MEMDSVAKLDKAIRGLRKIRKYVQGLSPHDKNNLDSLVEYNSIDKLIEMTVKARASGNLPAVSLMTAAIVVKKVS